MMFNEHDWVFLDTSVIPCQSGVLSVMPSIVGPIDVRSALLMRKVVERFVEVHCKCPIDIFVLSLGDAPWRDVTKIGGLPYLHRSEKWPLSDYGHPLPFLAQFDFRESLDLVEGVSGDFLLVFGNLDGEDGFKLLWQQQGLSDDELVGPNDVPNRLSEIPKFWGARWRTENYVEYSVDPQLDVMGFEVLDGLAVEMVSFALKLGGMTIGRCPFVLPGSPVTQGEEKILCSLTMVAPNLDSPYPFVNHPEPISENDYSIDTLNLAHLPGADFFGLLYVIQDSHNILKVVFTSL